MFTVQTDVIVLKRDEAINVVEHALYEEYLTIEQYEVHMRYLLQALPTDIITLIL